jgi:hypothetical protein
MQAWNTGRFRVNKDQLATRTDQLLVCGVKKARFGRGSVAVMEAGGDESIVDRPVYVRRRSRPGTLLSTGIFLIGAVIGFSAVWTWPL